MDERLKFIARLLDGDKMSVLCREFGISRKTGYKILKRYNACGLHGLTDRSRRPYRQANQLPVQIEKQIVRLKRERPTWGAPKIRERLRRLYPDTHSPAVSTVHAVLDHNEKQYGGHLRSTIKDRLILSGSLMNFPGLLPSPANVLFNNFDFRDPDDEFGDEGTDGSSVEVTLVDV